MIKIGKGTTICNSMVGNSVIMSGNKTVINGIEINVPSGANISVNNGVVYVNGKKYEDSKLEGKEVINIIIYGDVGSIKCGGSVTCNNVSGNVDCGGSCDCKDIGGSLDAGGSVHCGDVKGGVDAGGSVRMSR